MKIEMDHTAKLALWSRVFLFGLKASMVVFILSIPLHVNSTEAEVLLRYDSKYITEGRDNLAHGGLVSSELLLVNDSGFISSLWVGQGEATSYRESNGMLGWQAEFSAGTVSISHTWLDFKSLPSDREWALAFYRESDWVNLEASLTYSVEAQGHFTLITLSHPFDLSADFRLIPYFSAVYDRGYASQLHQGYNHSEIGLNGDWQINQKILANFKIALSEPAVDIESEGGASESWAGIGISYKF